MNIIKLNNPFEDTEICPLLELEDKLNIQNEVAIQKKERDKNGFTNEQKKILRMANTRLDKQDNFNWKKDTVAKWGNPVNGNPNNFPSNTFFIPFRYNNKSKEFIENAFIHNGIPYLWMMEKLDKDINKWHGWVVLTSYKNEVEELLK